jgi:hypothetical protein
MKSKIKSAYRFKGAAMLLLLLLSYIKRSITTQN